MKEVMQGFGYLFLLIVLIWVGVYSIDYIRIRRAVKHRDREAKLSK